MSHRAQNKTFIKEASPGISYYTLDKNAYGQRWNIAFHERSVSNMKVETVTFVMKGIVKLTAPFRSTGVYPRRKQNNLISSSGIQNHTCATTQ